MEFAFFTLADKSGGYLCCPLAALAPFGTKERLDFPVSGRDDPGMVTTLNIPSENVMMPGCCLQSPSEPELMSWAATREWPVTEFAYHHAVQLTLPLDRQTPSEP